MPLQDSLDKQLGLLLDIKRDAQEMVGLLENSLAICDCAKEAVQETMAEMDKPETNFGKVRYNLQYIFNCLTNVCG